MLDNVFVGYICTVDNVIKSGSAALADQSLFRSQVCLVRAECGKAAMAIQPASHVERGSPYSSAARRPSALTWAHATPGMG